MATIQRSEVLNELKQGLRLDPAREAIPSTTSPVLSPVYVTNPPPRLRNLRIGALGTNHTFTVPVGKRWLVLYGRVGLTTSATAGNRSVQLRLRDRVDTIAYQTTANATQAASLSENYILSPSFPTAVETTTDVHELPLPSAAWVESEGDVFFQDTAAVSVNDDWTIALMVLEYDDFLPG